MSLFPYNAVNRCHNKHFIEAHQHATKMRGCITISKLSQFRQYEFSTVRNAFSDEQSAMHVICFKMQHISDEQSAIHVIYFNMQHISDEKSAIHVICINMQHVCWLDKAKCFYCITNPI